MNRQNVSVGHVLKGSRFAEGMAVCGDAASSAERHVDNTALWDSIEQLTASVNSEDWAVVPCDGAENHDRYIYGQRRMRAE